MIELEGFVAAAHTPFDSEGRLALEIVERQARRFRRDGLGGVFVAGTTGEFAALSVVERRALADRWLEVRPADLAVAVHVGSTCLDDSADLARHAASRGADAIAMVPPYYQRPGSTDELVAMCAKVAAAAPETPFYYYHIPGLTGVGLPMTPFVDAALEAIPSFAGVKFSHSDLFDFGLLVARYGSRLRFLYGSDESVIAGLVLGAHGAIGSSYSFAAPLYRELRRALNEGRLDEARHFQSVSRDMVEVFFRYGLHPAMKVAMSLVGVDCGPVRLPLRTLDEEAKSHLARDLERIGFFEFASPPES